MLRALLRPVKPVISVTKSSSPDPTQPINLSLHSTSNSPVPNMPWLVNFHLPRVSANSCLVIEAPPFNHNGTADALATEIAPIASAAKTTTPILTLSHISSFPRSKAWLSTSRGFDRAERALVLGQRARNPASIHTTCKVSDRGSFEFTHRAALHYSNPPLAFHAQHHDQAFGHPAPAYES